MIYSIHLYLVPSENVTAFIAAIREKKLWRNAKQLLPHGLIAIDLLYSHAVPNGFLTIEFWTSMNAFRVVAQSPAPLVLKQYLSQSTTDCLDLGTFSFPVLGEFD